MTAKTTALDWRWRLSERFLAEDAAAEWAEVGGAAIVAERKEEGDAADLAFADLSPLPRFGVKGAADLLPGASPPVNRAAKLSPGGGVVARLGADEWLCLSNGDGGGLPDNVPAAAKLPRRDSHFWLGLCGARAEQALARLSALPPPAAGEAQQTMVAGFGGLLLRAENRAPAFYWLGESSRAEHAWESLERIIGALGGGAVGWRAAKERLF